MPSKFRLALVFLPVILGVTILAIGFDIRQQATDVITPKTPPIYGIMPFSSINFKFEVLHGVFWILNLNNGTIRILHDFVVSLPHPSDETASLEEQIFGFQFPYRVFGLRPVTEAKGWSELESDYVPIEIIDQKVHIEGETSIVYLIFTPLPRIRYYDFPMWFYCGDAIIQETFSTFTLYLPIAEAENNIFTDYFSNLNCQVLHLEPGEQNAFEIGVYLPPGNRVIEAYPPITRESMVSDERMFIWTTSYEFPIEPSHAPASKVLRINFENLAEEERREWLLFESGMLIGIGISEIVTGVYAILRFAAEKP